MVVIGVELELLEQRRFYLRTHARLPPHLRLNPSELDRIYDALVVYDGELKVEKVICPLCGWVSKPLSYKLTEDARVLRFGRIASTLMRHIMKSHEGLFERVWKGGRMFGMVTRAMYRCGECKAEDEGVVEILSHYLAQHRE
jgi:hypothetical protein